MNGRELRRAFVAVVPPADVLDAIDAALAPLREVAPPRLSWSRRSQWHLTLQFLGAVADAEALVDAVNGAVGAVRPFAVALGGSGAFPAASRASVLWVGIDEGADELSALASAVETATALLGFAADDRGFTPHLTVARARRPLPVGTALASIGEGPFGRSWDVREVLVMESDTRPTGAVYREIAGVPLRA